MRHSEVIRTPEEIAREAEARIKALASSDRAKEREAADKAKAEAEALQQARQELYDREQI